MEDLGIIKENLEYRFAYLGFFLGKGTLILDDVYLKYPDMGIQNFPFIGITE